MANLIREVPVRYFTIFAVLLGLIGGSVSATTIEDKATGFTFPSEVSFQYEGKEYQLEATGVATRKKFMFLIYSVASYLQKNGTEEGDKFARIMQPDTAKQLTLKWARDLGESTIREGFRSAILQNDTEGTLKSEVDKFVTFFGDIKKGEEQMLRWLPGGIIVVQYGGEVKGTIKNEAFAKALWSVWFGKKSVVNRNDLVKFMK